VCLTKHDQSFHCRGFFEQIAKEFLAYVPLYDELKVLFLLWLWMPQFKGATFIYDHYLAPWFKTNAKTLDSYASLGESKLNQVSVQTASCSPRRHVSKKASCIPFASQPE
jgi:hypothetical protein